MVMTSEQAKNAARKRWRERPIRMCEVCGKEHRCVRVWVEEGGEEEALKTLVGLFEQSVRGVIRVVRVEKKKGGEEGLTLEKER